MSILNENFNALKIDVSSEGKQLQDLIHYIGYTEQAEILDALINRIEDPFMFVIVGEVKAGKSSFVNALLDPTKEICKVAASPMTDTIQQIVYGEKEKVEYLSDHLKRIYQPIDILKEIAIVDTPGTNTIIAHHQEITERFVPMSDLIIFVFEAKNPYRQSAWEFFDYIKEDWRKKVVFILQQKDLLNQADLDVNMDGVKQFALKKGINEPLVFAVSALEEIQGLHERSGFDVLKTYITSNITGGKAPYLKLNGSIKTIQQINDNLSRGMVSRKSQFEADISFRSEVDLTLNHQEKQTNDQVNLLVENIIAKYDQITKKYTNELHERLNILTVLKKSFQAIFSKKENLKKWLEDMILEMDIELKEGMSKKLGDGVKNIAENIQYMAKMVDVKLQNNQTIMTKNHEIFSELAEKRANILMELQETFANFLNREENFYDKSVIQGSGNFSPDFVKGSGIAAIGIILAALTNGVIFDITGGILTTVGVIFAGVSIGIKRKKIEKKFEEEIQTSRVKLHGHIDEKMKNYVSNIKTKILRNFYNFDQYLEKEKQEIQLIDNKQQDINTNLNKISALIEKNL